MVRSSHLEVLFKKCVLKHFAKFTGKQLCQTLFFNKGLRRATVVKNDTPTQAFFFEFCKIFKRTSFYRTPSVASFRLLSSVNPYECIKKVTSLQISSKVNEPPHMFLKGIFCAVRHRCSQLFYEKTVLKIFV